MSYGNSTVGAKVRDTFTYQKIINLLSIHDICVHKHTKRTSEIFVDYCLAEKTIHQENFAKFNKMRREKEKQLVQ